MNQSCSPISSIFALFPFTPPPPPGRIVPPEEQPHFTNFMVQVEQGYGSGKDPGETNIYHNRRHATDVTQAVHYFLKVSSGCEVQATRLGDGEQNTTGGRGSYTWSRLWGGVGAL